MTMSNDINRSPTYFFMSKQASKTNNLVDKYASKSSISAEQTSNDIDAIPLENFAGQFWWANVTKTKSSEHKVLSTIEIAGELDSGNKIMAFRGPYSKRVEAVKIMENYWEAIMGYDD